MLQDSDGFEVLIDELSDAVAPDESHHHQQQQFFNAFYVRKMRILDVESRTLHCLEHRLNLPTLPIG